MNILVTGGAGYLGSVLIPKLLVRGHQVRVVDVGYFGVGHLRSFRPPIELIREDLRRVRSDAQFLGTLLEDCDCIIHLAAISNDPSAELNPALTEEVNYQVTVALAQAARDHGIRFLFSSSCSVYGEALGEIDESGQTNPLTIYADSKIRAEQELINMADSNWSPVILRNGTLFGYSPRMRFDLVVNIFSLYSSLYNEIKVFGDGQQWRPFLHVSDCARAFVFFAERKEHQHVCYNISHENLRVVDIVALFQALNPRIRVDYLEIPNQDRRNYQVATRRVQAEGFATRLGTAIGADEMVEAIVGGLIPDPESIYYRNAKWLKELSQIGSRDHRDIVGLMETLAQVRLPSRI